MENNIQNYEPEDLTDLEIEQLSEKEFRKKLFRRLDSIDGKVNPMYEIFSNVNGFGQITILLMKGIATLGGAILALYVVIEFIRRIGIPKQ